MTEDRKYPLDWFEDEIIYLNQDQWDQLMDLLDREPIINEKLYQLMSEPSIFDEEN